MMDERTWLTTTDLHGLLFQGVARFMCDDAFLGDHDREVRWERKLRLWSAGSLDRLAECLPRTVTDEARELLEDLADGRYSNEHFSDHIDRFRERATELVDVRRGPMIQIEREALGTLFECLSLDAIEAAEMGVMGTSRIRALVALGARFPLPDPPSELMLTEDLPIIELLRDIAGNPFRPLTFAAAWLTSDVKFLARGIYDDRAFDRLPILADALQDAGCNNPDILDHCRDTSLTHARGCWVVDLVLGKT